MCTINVRYCQSFDWVSNLPRTNKTIYATTSEKSAVRSILNLSYNVGGKTRRRGRRMSLVCFMPRPRKRSRYHFTLTDISRDWLEVTVIYLLYLLFHYNQNEFKCIP